MRTLKDFVTRTFAVVVTALAVAMAAASAWQRAADGFDRWLMVGLAVVIVLAVHLLPALLPSLHRLILWSVWALCFVVALWGHVWFFANAGHGAAESRVEASAQAKAIALQIHAIESALAANKARSAATVASILARTTEPDARAALEIELTEGRRANELRAQLVTLRTAQASGHAQTDPMMARVQATTGLPAEALNLAAGVMLATLLEIMGMLLWLAATSSDPVAEPVATAVAPVAETSPGPDADLERLRLAVRQGDCLPTLASIREYLRCGQARAMQLRRALVASTL